MSWDPRDPAFGVPPLPEWVTSFRDHQERAVAEVMGHLQAKVKYVLLDAPTGAGKTLIAEAIRRLHHRKMWYVCTTKSLQDQFVSDFPYAKVLKGRANYPTLDRPELFAGDSFQNLSCADCVVVKERLPACDGCNPELSTPDPVIHCPNCHPYYRCPYQQAKAAALQAELAVTNIAYFMTGVLGTSHDLVVVDECDTLESQLMGQIEINISDRRRRKLGLGFPGRKTVESAWQEWVVDVALPTVGHEASAVASQALARPTPENLKEATRLADLHQRLDRMAESFKVEDGLDWVYDSAGQDRGAIIFRPVKVDAAAPDMLWKASKQWVLMSATIIDPYEFTESLGIEPNEWELVRTPAVFPKENRPVWAVGGPNMSRKAIDAEGSTVLNDQAEVVARILRKHPDERVLVHTVSYKLATDLFDRLRVEFRDRLVVYGSAADREAALARYKELPAAVALAPSWDRGVDLPGDLCRVQVVAKVPFPNLGDKQVAKRLYTKGGDLWFQVQTVRTLVQMTGRGVRSATDECVTYITDYQFIGNVWSKSRRLLPEWWKEALRVEGMEVVLSG